MASDAKTKEEEQCRKYIIYCNVLGLLLVTAITTLTYRVDLHHDNLTSMSDRLAFALRLQMLSAVTVLAGVLWVASTRFYTPAMDTLSPEFDHYVAIPRRCLQNTVEQFLINFVGNLVLATYLPPNKMHMIALFVVFFVVGRLLFALGYRSHHIRRAFGFVMTFLPTFGVYIFCLYCSAKNLFGLAA